MTAIPTVWCPYCDSANELNSKKCWRCRQQIPSQAERTGVQALPASLPVAASVEGGELVRPTPGYRMMTATVEEAVPLGMMQIERKQCVYCREWIDPEASVCPFCRTDQGVIAAVQRATWSFVQLFLCFAALGTGLVLMVRLFQWGMTGSLMPGLGTIIRF